MREDRQDLGARRRSLPPSSFLVLVALAVACGGPDSGGAGDPPSGGDAGPRAGAPAPADTAIPAGITCDGLGWSILAVRPTRDGLRARFGAPVAVDARAVENRHVAGQIDTVLTVRYDGLHSEIYAVTGGRELPDHVLVTDGRFLAVPALGPGAPAERVTRALGEPTRRTPTSLVYECGEDVEEPVTFHLRGGAVERIEIDYYVD